MMAPLASHVRDALLVGPVAAPALDPETGALDTGYALDEAGTLHVAVCTAMPGVSPAQIDWWFGWHSDDPARYRMWHPLAHVHARWADGRNDDPRTGRARYVGRTSIVEEFIGSERARAAIEFVAPATFGLDAAAFADPARATAVCARIHFAGAPVEIGRLVHEVCAVAGGAEMRSRFWLGGPFAHVHGIGGVLSPLVRRVRRPSLAMGRDLLVHCAQEMSHLATFLPALHAEHSHYP
jgi:hypothetical protein